MQYCEQDLASLLDNMQKPFTEAQVRWVLRVLLVHIHAAAHSCKSVQTQTHTHQFNGPFSGTTQVSQYQKGKTSLDFTEAGDSEWH